MIKCHIRSLHLVTCGRHELKVLNANLRLKININWVNYMVSNLTYLQLSLRYTTFFFFRFRSNHPFGGVPLRCKTPTQLQSRQMAQQVPNHSGDAGTQLHPLTSFSLHLSLALSLSNWVISPALYPPLYFLLSPPSSFHVFFFLTPPLSPSAMDSPQPG